MNKIIDVIIPVYRPDDKLKKILARLERQETKVRKIILMHTEDGCEFEWICRRYNNVVICNVTPESFDHGATRDWGIQMSDADIVVCMTQDAIPADEWLITKLTSEIGTGGIAAAYARQLPQEGCDILERYTRRFNYPAESSVKSAKDLEALGIKTYFCSNVCAAYSRVVYEELGGFEKKTIFNEDMIFAAKLIKAGYQIAYRAGARVIHSHNYTNMQQFRRNFDMAVSQADHPEVFREVKSEEEGIRMVKQTAVYLLKVHRPWKIFSLIIKSAAKYAGYQAGMHYRKLPRWMIMRFTMNARYWGKM